MKPPYEITNKILKLLTSISEKIGEVINTFNGKLFTRKDYLNIFKEISPPTASRDLKLDVNSNIITKQGDKRMTSYKVNIKV